jgi:hypothetical protein
MRIEQISPPVTQNMANDVPALEVFIAYEDYETGRRVQEALGRVAGPARSIAGIRTSMWKFELLRLASLREYAALEAVNADLIWISIHGKTDLPDAMKSWISQWLQKKVKNDCALLVSLEGEETLQEPNGALGHLRKVAQRANLNLFAKFLVSRAETAVCCLHRRAPEVRGLSPILERILHQNESCSSWEDE